MTNKSKAPRMLESGIAKTSTANTKAQKVH